MRKHLVAEDLEALFGFLGHSGGIFDGMPGMHFTIVKSPEQIADEAIVNANVAGEAAREQAVEESFAEIIKSLAEQLQDAQAEQRAFVEHEACLQAHVTNNHKQIKALQQDLVNQKERIDKVLKQRDDFGFLLKSIETSLKTSDKSPADILQGLKVRMKSFAEASPNVAEPAATEGATESSELASTAEEKSSTGNTVHPG